MPGGQRRLRSELDLLLQREVRADPRHDGGVLRDPRDRRAPAPSLGAYESRPRARRRPARPDVPSLS
jgi:hypothetical protein